MRRPTRRPYRGRLIGLGTTVVYVSEEDQTTKRFGEGARPWARNKTAQRAASLAGSHPDQDRKAFSFLIKESSSHNVETASGKKVLLLSVEVENLGEEALAIFEAVLSWPGGSALAMASKQILKHFDSSGYQFEDLPSQFEDVPPKALMVLVGGLLELMVPWFESITPQTLSPREKAKLQGGFLLPKDVLDKRPMLRLTLNRLVSAEVRPR